MGQFFPSPPRGVGAQDGPNSHHEFPKLLAKKVNKLPLFIKNLIYYLILSFIISTLLAKKMNKLCRGYPNPNPNPNSNPNPNP